MIIISATGLFSVNNDYFNDNIIIKCYADITAILLMILITYRYLSLNFKVEDYW